MNPEPPPIADPHSTAPASPATAPRTMGTFVLALVHFVLAVLPLVAGVWLLVMIVAELGQTVSGHKSFVEPIVWYLVVPLFVLFSIGYFLIRHGLRIWKNGR